MLARILPGVSGINGSTFNHWTTFTPRNIRQKKFKADFTLDRLISQLKVEGMDGLKEGCTDGRRNRLTRWTD